MSAPLLGGPPSSWLVFCLFVCLFVSFGSLPSGMEEAEEGEIEMCNSIDVGQFLIYIYIRLAFPTTVKPA